jgi:hypothetical protein
MHPITNAGMGAFLLGTNKRYAEANPQSRVKRLSTIPNGHLNPARKFDFTDVLGFGDIYEVRLICHAHLRNASKAHIRKGRGLCCSFFPYAAFFACCALTLAHRALCAAAIFRRAAADNVRFGEDVVRALLVCGV